MFNTNIPLAERRRPSSLDDLVGQEHLTGQHGIIRKAIDTGSIPSMILWGPPGTGKTTIANIIANTLKVPFKSLSAINAGIKDVRDIINQARHQSSVILFIDEIHRFNKTQQDALLGAVEKGIITFIGATTENPSFEVNSALLSRCQVYTLNALNTESLESLIKKSLKEDHDLKKVKVNIKEYEALFSISGGDARKLLNLLEIVVETHAKGKKSITVTNKIVIEVAQQRVVLYDKTGEQHYDIVSAFIKSIRGSDPNATIYWLARMIEGGEDVKFIARRLLIAASEDIGNANPTALVIANNCFQAVNIIGYPEARIILSQCASYLACSPKSNASYKAINEAQQLVKEQGDLSVPLHLRNAPTKLMKEMNYGKDYQYAHNYAQNFALQEYMPEKISGKVLYEPGQNKREEELRSYLKGIWKEKYNY